MKKTIYNVAVLMESQEQCDRMKQLCIDNGLPITPRRIYDGFKYCDGFYKHFFYSLEVFQVWNTDPESQRIRVTESEFIELLKQEKA
jgi:hypothetical protein